MGKKLPPPGSGTCKITSTTQGEVLILNEVPYQFLRLQPDPKVAIRAFRLTKVGQSSSYTVHQDSHGWGCTCWDYISRRNNTGELCKHGRAIRALVEAGKL